TVKVWDARTGAEVLILKCPPSPNGAHMLTGSKGETPGSWKWDARRAGQVFPPRGHNGSVTWASFSPDGAGILTGSYDGTATVWDAKTGVKILTLDKRIRPTQMVDSASFSPDGARIVTGSLPYYRGTATVWDAVTGAEIVTLAGR